VTAQPSTVITNVNKAQVPFEHIAETLSASFSRAKANIDLKLLRARVSS
jgi:hypothetical protein